MCREIFDWVYFEETEAYKMLKRDADDKSSLGGESVTCKS